MTKQQIIFRHYAEMALQGKEVGTEVRFTCPYCRGQAFANKGKDRHHAFCTSCKQRFGGFYSLKHKTEAPQFKQETREKQLEALFSFVGYSDDMAEQVAKHAPAQRFGDEERGGRQADIAYVSSDSERKAIKELYERGYSSRQITAETGVHYKVLYRWYKATGNQPHAYIGRNNVGDEAMKYWKKGLCVAEIARALDKSENGVRAWLKRNNLAPNKKDPSCSARN